MMAVTGKNVNNIRFLDEQLGKLLINFLVYVLPVLESMAWQDDNSFSLSPFLWCDADGKRWSDDRFGDMLKAACKRAGIPEIGTAVWRQMSSAIINTHFDQAERACLAVCQDAAEPEGVIDEDGEDATAATLVAMSNHSLRTHRHSYANVSPFANVWDGKLLKSLRASQAWAGFFSRDKDKRGGHKRGLSSTGEEQDTARKILNIGRERGRRHWTGLALLYEARRLYQDNSLSWSWWQTMCPR
jgi:hypothetical protein